MPKREAEAAPAPTKTATCAKCGVTFTYERRGGAPRKFCDKHTRGSSAKRSESAAYARRSMTELVKAESEAAAAAARVARLAAGLRVHHDLESAAALFGVDATGKELRDLAVLARAHYDGVIAGDMVATGRLAQAVTHALLADVLAERHMIPSRDKPHALKTVHTIARELIPEGNEANWTAINLVFTPPPADGKLTPEQRAKIRGDPVEAGGDE